MLINLIPVSNVEKLFVEWGSNPYWRTVLVIKPLPKVLLRSLKDLFPIII